LGQLIPIHPVNAHRYFPVAFCVLENGIWLSSELGSHASRDTAAVSADATKAVPAYQLSPMGWMMRDHRRFRHFEVPMPEDFQGEHQPAEHYRSTLQWCAEHIFNHPGSRCLYQ
jgi:hypothetical protein